jgi:photosystem II stability/assembly factor-like uncharacterized protein
MKLHTLFRSAALGLCLAAGFAAQPSFGQAVASQPYVWKSVTVVAGGFIPGIVYSTRQQGLMYCRCDIGSAYKSDNGGKTWIPLTDWNGVSNYQGTESIAADPVDANRVYIAAGMGPGPAAIMRSMDQGKTFQVVPIPVTMGGNSNGRGVGERLAVDPCDNNVLYFGTRQDGLWTSTDAALHWNKVASFPATGGGAGGARGGRGGGGGGGGGAGLSFVIFDPAGSTSGQPCKNIYVGSSDRGDAQLFRSTDAGKTWAPVPGQPTGLLAIHGQLDAQGMMYLVFDSGVGPGGVADGAVWKFNTKDGTWTNITPDLDPANPGQRLHPAAVTFMGGFGGLGMDRQHPGTLVVASLNRRTVDDDDQIYRTTDGGKTWHNLTARAVQDPSLSPYLNWGKPKPTIGWWEATLQIDPFDSNRVCFATGATIWGCADIANADTDQPTHWSVWAGGIEETAVLDLVSPTAGPHLISAFGDISGFTHDDLSVSPPMGMHLHPLFTNTNMVDVADMNPKIVIRTGSPALHIPDRDTMAYSEDGGYNWKPFTTGPAPAGGGRGAGRGGGGGGGGVTLNADGSVFMSLGATPAISKDRGKTWTPCVGLAAGLRPTADRVNPLKFYALDTASKQVYTSTDGGATFKASPSAVPAAPAGGGRAGGGGGGGRLRATLGIEGDLWIQGGRLMHSTDGGATFTALAGNPSLSGGFGFGKAPPGKTYPALFAAGNYNGQQGVFRSDDIGVTWVRINDDQHQYGNRWKCLCGDPRIYGRVYVGTDGRGILYGDIAQ